MSLLKIKVVHPTLHGVYDAYAYTHMGDCGVDLVCPERITVPPGGVVKIDLGIQTEMLNAEGGPQSFYLHPRSSMSKTPLSLANSAGVIDASYRGNLKAVVRHHVDLEALKLIQKEGTKWLVNPHTGFYLEPYVIEKGTSLFQICCPNLCPISVEETDALSDSTRGAHGFGSTGTRVDLPTTPATTETKNDVEHRGGGDCGEEETKVEKKEAGQ